MFYKYRKDKRMLTKKIYWCPLKIIAVFRNVCFVGQPMSWTCREPISGLKSQEKAKKRK